MDNNSIGLNIWDDYYEDGYVPLGEIQETFAYIESGLDHEQCKEILSLVEEEIKKLPFSSKLDISLDYYDSAKVYPHLVGSEHEMFLYQRWQLIIQHLTHEMREKLVNSLKALQLTYHGIKIDVYSES